MEKWNTKNLNIEKLASIPKRSKVSKNRFFFLSVKKENKTKLRIKFHQKSFFLYASNVVVCRMSAHWASNSVSVVRHWIIGRSFTENEWKKKKQKKNLSYFQIYVIILSVKKHIYICSLTRDRDQNNSHVEYVYFIKPIHTHSLYASHFFLILSFYFSMCRESTLTVYIANTLTAYISCLNVFFIIFSISICFRKKNSDWRFFICSFLCERHSAQPFLLYYFGDIAPCATYIFSLSMPHVNTLTKCGYDYKCEFEKKKCQRRKKKNGYRNCISVTRSVYDRLVIVVAFSLLCIAPCAKTRACERSLTLKPEINLQCIFDQFFTNRLNFDRDILTNFLYWRRKNISRKFLEFTNKL